MEILTFFQTRVDDFILIFARTSAILAVAPIFGTSFVNQLTKAFFAFILAALFTGALSPLPGREMVQQHGLVIVIAQEVAAGAAIGIAASLFFEMVIFAGYITDYQIGFGFINIVDPMSGQSISIISFFSNMLAMILFLVLNLHHYLIQAIAESYRFLPVFGASLSHDGITFLMSLFGHIFLYGFKLAAPMIAIMFTVDFTMGILGKTVPQLQILVVGFPVKISIGLITFGLALKEFANHITLVFSDFRNQLFWIIKALGVAS
ncbi:MAG: flagellar biosynthetic protein FliR [Acidobacteria bacterium]|nr:MAG: flagellar biosynthetic protein FliR [Acidobacteriota bacterium]PIE90462.1 MAG: flagellar biosynthetic protein FliR [Acidobacteriota bacterium]